jgi:hypothetical protein
VLRRERHGGKRGIRRPEWVRPTPSAASTFRDGHASRQALAPTILRCTSARRARKNGASAAKSGCWASANPAIGVKPGEYRRASFAPTEYTARARRQGCAR